MHVTLSAKRFQRCPKLEAAATSAEPLRTGKQGEAVEILQQALIDLGYSMPKSIMKQRLPDGIFGSETDRTVRDFQKQQSLVSDGVVGRNTMARLDQIFQVREQAEQAKMYSLAHTKPPLGPWYVS
jgi:peptidoglycan hydrolase-like protein with peptidoglycan-binding domain